jgi:hypothetical protein
MSYRAYVPQFLDRVALKEKNRNAPEGQKFCNAICQDYLPKTSFSSVHVLCNSCRNRIHLAEKQIATQKISMQDFHKDPMVVYKTHPDGVLITKACIVCKNEKAIFQYEPNRKECKSCHGLQTTARARENVSDYITDIEQIKTNMEQLEVYLEHIPKDTLILLIAHYQVGRKASDVKSTMVHNMVQHFRALLSPEKCQGGCGVSVVEPHSKCGTCQEKPVVHKNEKRQHFIDNLDTLVDSLEPMTNRALDVDRFNKDQLTMVARKLGLKFEQKIPKNDLFDLVNEALETRQVEREKERAVEELQLVVTDKKVEDLVMNGLTIQARGSDCYINATMLCKAGNKNFFDWYRLSSTKSLLDIISQDLGIPAIGLVDSKKGNSSQYSQGSWVHPDLAVQLAQWISPEFLVRVCRWVRQIVITGDAHRDQIMTNAQLIEMQMEIQKKDKQLQNKEEQIKKLEIKHKSILQRREYHKFEKGSCFYIVRVNDTDFKLGYEGMDINMRLRAYRTGNPMTRACHIVYSSDALFIEQGMLKRFLHKKLEQNHEVVTDVLLSDLIHTCHTIVEFFHLNYHIVPADSLEKYNES